MAGEKKYLTTGQAAAIFDVDPDTVLRWIKSGEIPAIRTPGGHYRVNRSLFLSKILSDNDREESVFPRCWEYYSESGVIREECKDCIVYRSKAIRCYELCALPLSIGHEKLFCTDSCKNCLYYKDILYPAG